MGSPGVNQPAGGTETQASLPNSGTGTGDDATTTEGTNAARDGTDIEPGFVEDRVSTASLPDMRDVVPTYGVDTTLPQATETASDEGDASSHGGNTDQRATGAMPGDSATASTAAGSASGTGPGTRAEGGLDSALGDGPLTTAEQVAILDRQLEQSTSDFDTMILEEQQRQREAARGQTQTRPASSEPEVSANASSNSPYQDDVAMGGMGGNSGGGRGGIGGGSQNPAIYEAPDDIPSGNDDDVVARQLREAAMREPDPAIRERLWNEYRKYKGLEIPQ